MSLPFSNTRIGEMLDAIAAKAESAPASEEVAQTSVAGAQRLCFAAMGADYLRATALSRTRTPEEALKHWLTFCSVANTTLFNTDADLQKLIPILRSVMLDMRDIHSGKIQ